MIASGSTGTSTGARLVIYPHIADDGTSPNQGYINQSVFGTGSIGTDIFVFVSGGIGQRNVGGAQSITCFGGDIHISGNITVDGTFPGSVPSANYFWSPSDPYIEASGSLAISGSGYFQGGLSGSLQEISSGIPYLVAGPNVIIVTNSLGQVEITGSGGGGSGSSFYRLELLDYAAVNNTNSTTVGQVIFPANQFTGSIVLHGVVANSISTATGSIQLYNVTSGAYVEIGGSGVTHISVSGTNPTIITSVNLISASNFNSSSQAIYELHVSSSNGSSYGFFGGFELRPSGSFTGVSYITSSTYFTYVSGTWEDGGNRLATTSSVALAGNHGTGFFADNVGTDVFFYVSGSSGSKDTATPGVALFGGDVVISGGLYGGSPLKVKTQIQINTPISDNVLVVNGIDITPYHDNVTVPSGSSSNHALIDLGSFLENDQFANVNVDISAITIGLTTVTERSFAAWKLFVSLLKQDNEVSVVDVTVIDSHTLVGSTATDDSGTWDVNASSDGIIYASTSNADNNIAFNATITKISVADIFTGNIIK
ncbi:hypothetical protein EBU71_11120 [bacterium]|nr:hypothetical protein [Candidatus Elulimicrobium humile]